jgi:hypothetical protein
MMAPHAQADRDSASQVPPYAQHGEGDHAQHGGGVGQNLDDNDEDEGGNPSTALRAVPLPALRAGRISGSRHLPIISGDDIAHHLVLVAQRQFMIVIMELLDLSPVQRALDAFQGAQILH